MDGMTGGFNFQAAWTTAYTVASSIQKSLDTNNLLTNNINFITT